MTDTNVYPFDLSFSLAETLILLSLSRQTRHGYELDAHVVNLSHGRLLSGRSTIYKAVRRLEKQDLVRQLEAGPGERRKYFEITNSGSARLGRDLRLLKSIVATLDYQ